MGDAMRMLFLLMSLILTATLTAQAADMKSISIGPTYHLDRYIMFRKDTIYVFDAYLSERRVQARAQTKRIAYGQSC